MSNDTKRRISAAISLVVSGLLFSSVPAFAQTVADAARQERARKHAHPLHVYTNEDLKRTQILVPEDQVRANNSDPAASAQASAGPVEPSANDGNSRALALTARQVGPAARRKGTVATGAAPNVNANAAPAGIANSTPQSLQFPLSATFATPRAADKSAVPIPVVNLPMQLTNAIPLAAPNETLAFPVLEPSNFVSPRSAARASDILAPVVPYAPPQGIPVAPQAISIAVPAELVATPWLPTPKAESIATVEPPVMPPLASPMRSFDTPQPLQAPLAPTSSVPTQRPVQKNAHQPIQAPALTLEESAVRTVLVETGDSLWKLAERYLGNGKRWVELARLNPQLANPGLIRPGDSVHLPVPVHGNTRQVVIRRGDTLWSVARVQFGQGLAFSCIAHANQLQSADVIQAGETLVLPEDCAQ